MSPSIEKTPSVAIMRRRLPCVFFERLLELAHVAVRVAVAVGLAEADAVDDRRVVERVADDGVLLAEQRLEEAAVGVEARRVEDGVLGAEERRRSCASSVRCASCVPQMKRTLERPKPYSSSAVCAASITRGCELRPR